MGNLWTIVVLHNRGKTVCCKKQFSSSRNIASRSARYISGLLKLRRHLHWNGGDLDLLRVIIKCRKPTWKTSNLLRFGLTRYNRYQTRALHERRVLSYSIVVIPVSGRLFRISSISAPLLKLEFLDRVGVIRWRNLVGKNWERDQPWPGGRSDRVVILASVVTSSAEIWPHREHPAWYTSMVSSQMVLGIWIGTCFQQELNKVEVGHVAKSSMPRARGVCRMVFWDSVDVAPFQWAAFTGWASSHGLSSQKDLPD
jgi:hypothetical protein